ncbi:helix-turn-helix domain-containing protein [Streptomyces sp. NPDC059651]|uniref:helix-turn-helix domain-containing protein n=1 Tax=Streptomyces sp. NPDC059651 TaxID=3346897 RepID=UPI0036824B56
MPRTCIWAAWAAHRGRPATLSAVTQSYGWSRAGLRARIVLAAADGLANGAIARELEISVNTVRKWRGRRTVTLSRESSPTAPTVGRRRLSRLRQFRA